MDGTVFVFHVFCTAVWDDCHRAWSEGCCVFVQTVKDAYLEFLHQEHLDGIIHFINTFIMRKSSQSLSVLTWRHRPLQPHCTKIFAVSLSIDNVKASSIPSTSSSWENLHGFSLNASHAICTLSQLVLHTWSSFVWGALILQPRASFSIVALLDKWLCCFILVQVTMWLQSCASDSVVTFLCKWQCGDILVQVTVWWHSCASDNVVTFLCKWQCGYILVQRTVPFYCESDSAVSFLCKYQCDCKHSCASASVVASILVQVPVWLQTFLCKCQCGCKHSCASASVVANILVQVPVWLQTFLCKCQCGCKHSCASASVVVNILVQVPVWLQTFLCKCQYGCKHSCASASVVANILVQVPVWLQTFLCKCQCGCKHSCASVVAFLCQCGCKLSCASASVVANILVQVPVWLQTFLCKCQCGCKHSCARDCTRILVQRTVWLHSYATMRFDSTSLCKGQWIYFCTKDSRLTFLWKGHCSYSLVERTLQSHSCARDHLCTFLCEGLCASQNSAVRLLCKGHHLTCSDSFEQLCMVTMYSVIFHKMSALVWDSAYVLAVEFWNGFVWQYGDKKSHLFLV